jgi:hypothetical protein
MPTRTLSSSVDYFNTMHGVRPALGNRVHVGLALLLVSFKKLFSLVYLDPSLLSYLFVYSRWVWDASEFF